MMKAKVLKMIVNKERLITVFELLRENPTLDNEKMVKLVEEGAKEAEGAEEVEGLEKPVVVKRVTVDALNARTRWTEMEDQKLAFLVRSNLEVPEMAKQMGRSHRSVSSRIDKLYRERNIYSYRSEKPDNHDIQ